MSGPPAQSALSVAVGWLLFTALVVAIGALLGRWWIGAATPAQSRPRATVQAVAAAFCRGAAALLPLAIAGVLVRQIVEFHDPFIPLADDVRTLMGTPWGGIWTAAAAVSVVAGLAFTRAAHGSRRGWWAAGIATVALTTFPGLTGHAGGEAGLRVLTVPADALHVFAAGGWIGGLTFLLASEWRWSASHPGEHASLLPTLVPRFSRQAMASVATLGVTGTFAAWTRLSTLDALWTTTYGRILLIKLGLVGVVLALGGMNFRFITPRLIHPRGQRAMRRTATAELVVANLVLLVTAILVRTSPMAG